MASLDFVYDLKDKLDEEGIEYVICILKNNEQEQKIDMHLNLLSDESADMICMSFDQVCNKSEEDGDDDLDISFDDNE
jgi:hypothetical protein